MRQSQVNRPLIGPRRPASIPIAVAIFLIGLVVFWVIGLTVPSLLGRLTDGYMLQPCQLAEKTSDVPAAAVPACLLRKVEGFGHSVVQMLSHPNAEQLAEARQVSTGAWLSALVQASFNMLVVAAFAIGLIGLWGTIAVRLSRRVHTPRPDDPPY